MKGAFPSKESENLPDLHARHKPRARQGREEEKRAERSNEKEWAEWIHSFCLSQTALAAMASSSVALYIGVLVVFALVNLMSESFVEGRSLHLDEGISMVTEALPQQQYFSLPAERFTEFLGNTPSVVSFASFVTKYVFSAFLCQINLFYGLGRFSFFLSSFFPFFFSTISCFCSTGNPSEAACYIAV